MSDKSIRPRFDFRGMSPAEGMLGHAPLRVRQNDLGPVKFDEYERVISELCLAVGDRDFNFEHDLIVTADRSPDTLSRAIQVIWSNLNTRVVGTIENLKTTNLRNCVLQGRLDALTGEPTFIYVPVGAPRTVQMVIGPDPREGVMIAFASGFTDDIAIDYTILLYSSTSDAQPVEWINLPVAGTGTITYYLYAEYDTINKLVLFGTTLLRPLYRRTFPISATQDQHLFKIPEMKMYRYNLGNWEPVLRVFLGHAIMSTVQITSVVSYLYMQDSHCMYGDGSLLLKAGGLDRDVVIVPSGVGKVGIGTYDDATGIHDARYGFLQIHGDGTNIGGLAWYQGSGTTARAFLKSDGAGDFFLHLLRGSSDTDGLVMDRYGRLGVGGSPASRLHVRSVLDEVQLSVQGSSIQTQPLQEWRNNAGNILARVTSLGRLGIGVSSTAADALLHLHTGSLGIASIILEEGLGLMKSTLSLYPDGDTSVLALSPESPSGTRAAAIRLFATTPGIGRKSVDLFRRAGDSLPNSSLASDGDSYLHVGYGNLGIGTRTPVIPLDIASNSRVRASASLSFGGDEVNPSVASVYDDSNELVVEVTAGDRIRVLTTYGHNDVDDAGLVVEGSVGFDNHVRFGSDTHVNGGAYLDVSGVICADNPITAHSTNIRQLHHVGREIISPISGAVRIDIPFDPVEYYTGSLQMVISACTENESWNGRVRSSFAYGTWYSGQVLGSDGDLIRRVSFGSDDNGRFALLENDAERFPLLTVVSVEEVLVSGHIANSIDMDTRWAISTIPDYLIEPDDIDTVMFVGRRILSGSSTFVSTPDPRTVSLGRGFPSTDYRVIITPSASPSGYLGEVWVENKTMVSFDVRISGTTAVSFDWIAIFDG